MLGFAFGVWCLQQQASLPSVYFCATCCLCVLFFRQYAFAVIAAACVFGFSYAAWRADLRLTPHLPVAYEQREIALTGFVRGLPEPGDDGTRFLFEVESNDAGLRDFPRIVRLSWMAPGFALEAGQRWKLHARLKRPHSEANFLLRDMEVSMLERGIRATGYVSGARRLSHDAIGPSLMIDRLRARMRGRIEHVLGDAPHRGIVIALAVGAQDAVSDTDWSLMRATGTSHLVAISGLHIGFVAGLAALLCGFVWRRLKWRRWHAPLFIAAPKIAALGGAIFAAFYAALAGFNVPAQRTLWMLAVVAIAYACGRRPASSMILCWALAFVLLADPWAVTSPGFWLSFGAVAAILYAIDARGRQATKALEDIDAEIDWKDRDIEHESVGIEVDYDEPVARRKYVLRLPSIRVPSKLINHIRSSARVQYAVTLALAPLTVYWFSQIPLIGPLANAFAIPWVSFFVTPAVLAGLMLPAPLDAIAFHAAHAALSLLCDALAYLAAHSRLASPLWRLPQPSAWAMAAACIGVIWALAPRGWPMRFAAPLTWLPLLAPASHTVPIGDFRVTALDIGQGSALVVQTAHHALLFDAGPGPESTHAGERITAPYLLAAGVNTLDTMLISHSDSDHSGGAPAVLESIGVKQLLASLPAANALWSDARTHGADVIRCVAGQHWTWDRVDFQILWPDAGPLEGSPNHQACVMKATSASGRSALFTADIEADVERTLIARDKAALHADVLIVPHHGSRTSSTEPFLDSVGPLAAIFQVGYRNRFHHPNATVFARYQMRDIPLARSDEDGAARIDIGSEISLERYRQSHARYWMNR
nr:DNA internalization-related competence protein ComEC/Rec2 [Caballeronia sp. BR00000012568055]